MKNVIVLNEESTAANVSKNIILLLFLLLNFYVITVYNNSISGSLYGDENKAIVNGTALINAAADSGSTTIEFKR